MLDTGATNTQVSEFEELLQYLSPTEIAELDELLGGLEAPPWTPLPGPQTMALHSEADELFFGGAAGGGKTDLVIGLALTEHWDSIIFRRQFAQLKGIRKRTGEVFGHLGKYNGGDLIWRITEGEYAGKTIELGACQFEGDEQKYQGRPHDLKAFDELPHFTEAQYRFLKGWNRTTRIDPRTGRPQRTRVVAAGNPPINAEGQWVIRYWAPWLDPTHPNPAKPGELRWFITDEAGEDLEVSGPDPVWGRIDGVEQKIYPTSRTFVPAKVQDNPYLMDSGYLSVLQSLPEPLRSRMLGGNFGAGEEDDEWQVIPSAWILAAQARWAPTYHEYLVKAKQRREQRLLEKGAQATAELAPIEEDGQNHERETADQTPGTLVNSLAVTPRNEGAAVPEIESMGGVGVDLSAILTLRQKQLNADFLSELQAGPLELPGAKDVGVDVSRGGRDKTVVSERIGAWFRALQLVPGSQTPDGTAVIDLLKKLGYVGWRCKIDVVGVGSSPVDIGRLEDMNIVAMNGAETSHATDRSGTLQFANSRSEWLWLFREALDPELGLDIALPPDPELSADLCAPRWTLTSRGITVEDKAATKKRIGRSPDKGDAVINAFAQPNIVGQGFLSYYREQQKLAKLQKSLEVAK